MSNNYKLWLSIFLTIVGIVTLTWFSLRNNYRNENNIKKLEMKNQTIDSLTNEIILRDTLIIDSLRGELQSKEQIIGTYEYMWTTLSDVYPQIAKKIEKETE